MGGSFKINECKRHVSKKPQNPSKNIILSPVYVRRVEPGGGENMERYLFNRRHGMLEEEKLINRESCTQTSKTIFELAKLERLENGYMSPDSLNVSPHSDGKPEKNYNSRSYNREVNNYYKEVNNLRKQNYDDSRCMNVIQEDDSNPNKSLTNIKRRIHSFPQKSGESNLVQEKCIGDQRNDAALLWEGKDGSKNKPKLQNQYEIWHAQVYNEKINENPTPKAPIVVNIINSRTDKFLKDNKTSLIKEFLHSKNMKSSSFQSKPNRRDEKFLQNQPNMLKSMSYIEANSQSVRKKSGSGKLRFPKREATFTDATSEKLAQFYKKCENKLKEVRELNSDLKIPKGSPRAHAFTRRSNSFMSPTLSSERKSLKHAVDHVKNLVNKNLSGRSNSPSPSPVNLTRTQPNNTNSDNSINHANEEECFNIKLNMSDSLLRSVSSFQGSNVSLDNSLIAVLGHVKSADWNHALKGLAEIVELARTGDPEVLMPFMPMVNQRLLDLMRSPRSHVSRTACQLAGHLFEHMKDTRRPEFDDIVNLLLHKTADANKFIRQDANVALDTMVSHIPTFHTIRAICAKGPSHRNYLVRSASARLLLCAVIMAGPDLLLTHSCHEHSRRRIIVNLSILLEDKNSDTRKFAERLYRLLSGYKNFEHCLKKYLDRKKVDGIIKTQKRTNKHTTELMY